MVDIFGLCPYWLARLVPDDTVGMTKVWAGHRVVAVRVDAHAVASALTWVFWLRDAGAAGMLQHESPLPVRPGAGRGWLDEPRMSSP